VLQNVLHYLAPGLTLGATDVTTGQSVSFVPPPGTRELKVVRPDGVTQTLRPPFPPFTDTSRPGVYTVERVAAGSNAATTTGDSFAANFFPSRPAPAGGPTTLHLGRARASKSVTTFFSVNVAWMFCLAALALLGAEWWVAFRGASLGSRVLSLRARGFGFRVSSAGSRDNSSRTDAGSRGGNADPDMDRVGS
jgi:hypothetical protein